MHRERDEDVNDCIGFAIFCIFVVRLSDVWALSCSMCSIQVTDMVEWWGALYSLMQAISWIRILWGVNAICY